MTLVSKENLFVLRSLLSDWKYFWNKYCNFLFLAICRSQFPLLVFLVSSWIKKKKLRCKRAYKIKKKFEQNDLLKKKWVIVIFKGFIKEPVKLNKVWLFSVFLFSLTSVWVIFLFSYKSVCKSLKIEKISSASFHYI